jgi:hypothetical protein
MKPRIGIMFRAAGKGTGREDSARRDGPRAHPVMPLDVRRIPHISSRPRTRTLDPLCHPFLAKLSGLANPDGRDTAIIRTHYMCFQ